MRRRRLHLRRLRLLPLLLPPERRLCVSTRPACLQEEELVLRDLTHLLCEVEGELRPNCLSDNLFNRAVDLFDELRKHLCSDGADERIRRKRGGVCVH